jgi:hypothetical protein
MKSQPPIKWVVPIGSNLCMYRWLNTSQHLPFDTFDSYYNWLFEMMQRWVMQRIEICMTVTSTFVVSPHTWDSRCSPKIPSVKNQNIQFAYGPFGALLPLWITKGKFSLRLWLSLSVMSNIFPLVVVSWYYIIMHWSVKTRWTLFWQMFCWWADSINIT